MGTSSIVLDKGKEGLDLNVKRVVLLCPLRMVALELLKQPRYEITKFMGD